jgi:DNA-binding CsgD family transcriptional regulator
VDDQDTPQAQPPTQLTGRTPEGIELVFADVSVRAAIRRMYKRAEWQLADVVVRAAIKGRLTDTEEKEGRSESSLVILTANENLDRLLETLDKYAAAIAAKGALWLESGISGRQPPSPTQGNVPLFPTMEGEDLERSTPPLEPLTPRQLDILRLLARGRTNREIAEELILSTGTVRTHVERIIARLGARDRTTAVVRAIQLGLITPEAED